MSTQLIQTPFAIRRAMPARLPQSGIWQRRLQAVMQTFEAIGRRRAERELQLLAMGWDGTSPELARQARLAAAACAAPTGR